MEDFVLSPERRMRGSGVNFLDAVALTHQCWEVHRLKSGKEMNWNFQTKAGWPRRHTSLFTVLKNI